MKELWFKAVPFDKVLVTLALESGVDGIIAEREWHEAITSLGRARVAAPEDFVRIELTEKQDEERAVEKLKAGEKVLLGLGWEIIPVENILAQAKGLAVEAANIDQARLAAGILECGVDTVVAMPEAAPQLKEMVREVKLSQGRVQLAPATITAIENAGMGHRVCVDTLSLLNRGQGMLIGNSSGFTFLVHAETESNPYVAARPFRINAGAVHAYAVLPNDKTCYLEELSAGREVLIVGADGQTTLATVGRNKLEIRPMLLIRARVDETGEEGAVFLQNAETIRLVTPASEPVSVVTLREGDKVLVRTDAAGRHFGMRICEEIKEG
jgi:3-dehydroquinate synthase II